MHWQVVEAVTLLHHGAVLEQELRHLGPVLCLCFLIGQLPSRRANLFRQVSTSSCQYVQSALLRAVELRSRRGARLEK